MIADSEILSIANEVMTGLNIPNFEIKISDRRLLEAIIEVAGADLERFPSICSSIDKLDKQPWSEIAVELIEEKGIAKEIVDKLEPIV
jgi:histidyl-tRNA synthetase